MPLPAHVTRGQGEFVIQTSFTIAITGHNEPRLERARQRFLDILTRETGIPFSREVSSQAVFIAKAEGPSVEVQKLGEDESYRLVITSADVQLTALSPLGILHGLQTFLQLVGVTPRGFSVPAVAIEDSPRFPWRGLLIDSGHRFVPVAAVKRNLDGMEAVKLNVLHWRFADDQGFHIESKKLPLLQQKASGGLYYTQEEVREVIAYARDRGIRVMPEFDMPCHTRSWFLAYPELASRGAADSAGFDPSKESTYKLLATFIGEMAALFPDAYFHTGGDECDPKEWESNPRIAQYMREHKFANGAALQAMFTGRVEKIVAANKKIMVGWDEVLQPNTPKDVVIQSWRGQASLADAAREGYRGVLSWGYYIDLNQSAAEHYQVDPMGDAAAKLTPEQQARILGGEATMWTDIVSHENMDNRIWPRTAAIAERFWSPQEVRDLDSMYARLSVVSQKLSYYGPRHKVVTEEFLERMSGDPDPMALRVLASVLQPPRLYQRQELRSDFTAINRMDDAVEPESETARQFDEICKRIVAGKALPADWQQARAWLTMWRDNDAKLQPELARSALTQDLAPVSKKLAQVAEIGLGALNALEHGEPIAATRRQESIALVQSAEKPVSVLLIMPAASVQRLLEATKEASVQN
ncbi:family 20 glycosylhydrolase [Candidatus Korobacter versatilis]|nr:family 20 glycosylhydrolase [Candidatus Koribacter versatilis]